MRYRAVAVFLLSGATLACADTACLTLPAPVVQADIRDSVTGAPAAYQASLTVAGNGMYDSTFVGPPADSLAISVIRSRAPGRTGDYTVRVRRTGYRLREQTGVHIEGSGCTGALSVALSVRLEPLP